MSANKDVVYGIRRNRKESFFLRVARATYYKSISMSGGATPPANAGEFMLARFELIDSISKVGGTYPYIRGLVAQTRPAFDTVTYDWAVRDIGKSRNSLPDLIDQALNGLVTTARTPLRIALFAGVVASMLGVVLGIVNLILFASGATEATSGIPTLIVATFLFGGFQLFFIGLIGEYVLSLHAEIRPEPPMFERERINF
jgi:hypothetical protein